jgi:hypothetical protein
MPLLPIRARAHTHTSPPGKCSRVLGATPQEKEAGEKYHARRQRGGGRCKCSRGKQRRLACSLASLRNHMVIEVLV